MREESASPDADAARIAARQHGVVSQPQLLATGISTSGISRRLDAGHLYRIHRGVYAVGHPSVAREGRWMAAVLACGGGESDRGGAILDCSGAALSHRSAAELWGLLPPRDGAVHVSVPGGGGRKRRRGIQIHRCPSLLPAAVTLREGIPVTTPTRTASDLRRAASAKDRLGVVSTQELRQAIRQAEVLGLPVGPETTVDHTRSELERRFLRLCRRHRLPTPDVNVRVGPFLVDFLWREQRLIVETDGYRYHRGRIAFEDDRDRDLRLRSMGYQVLRLSHRQVAREPEPVVVVLRAALKMPGTNPERLRQAHLDDHLRKT